jgi:hypothetical protein
VIDNFEPQPYPLEASIDDGVTWTLVLGWRKRPTGELEPLIAGRDDVHYRLADARSIVRSPQSETRAALRSEPVPARKRST